ncbi:F-box/kelch-repeat protein At3g23880-like [Gastrolobium bilobum]|uniref:F-box/kelch-repeat protein At3g23880-like n=1 Tax=Gastrolobium bilobum TaxID=150636 RepID=UPI002AB0322A|nr:F-box/kelch-repeat protein At3g23880-like [Gastrolobium bilobum]
METLKKTKKMKLPLRSDSFTRTHTLPDELIEEILQRLPVRSLLRFKCVCKSWLALISNPQFAKSHYDMAAAPTHRLLLVKTYPDGPLESIGIDAPLHDDSARVYLPRPQSSLIPSVSSNYLEILGSCRGIILLKYRKEDDDLILWNPSTGARKTISCSPGHKFLYGFGYDPSTDDYLVVIAMESSTKFKTHMEFFSLKTNSWNKVKGINFPYFDNGTRVTVRSGFLLNEALHWVVFSKGDFTKDVIIAFDLIKRSLSEILLPPDFPRKYEIWHFMVIEGCLGLACSRGVCWVMKEYKVQLSWTKSIVSSNINCYIEHIPCGSYYHICFSIRAGIVGSDDRGKLLKLDDKGELLEISRIMQWLHKERPLRCAIYTESLQSFPSDFGET